MLRLRGFGSHCPSGRAGRVYAVPEASMGCAALACAERLAAIRPDDQNLAKLVEELRRAAR